MAVLQTDRPLAAFPHDLAVRLQRLAGPGLIWSVGSLSRESSDRKNTTHRVCSSSEDYAKKIRHFRDATHPFGTTNYWGFVHGLPPCQPTKYVNEIGVVPRPLVIISSRLILRCNADTILAAGLLPTLNLRTARVGSLAAPRSRWKHYKQTLSFFCYVCRLNSHKKLLSLQLTLAAYRRRGGAKPRGKAAPRQPKKRGGLPAYRRYYTVLGENRKVVSVQGVAKCKQPCALLCCTRGPPHI